MPPKHPPVYLDTCVILAARRNAGYSVKNSGRGFIEVIIVINNTTRHHYPI
jgi:hypothetical protein